MTEVLIVEDERVCARQYTALLRSAGYATRTARTARTALEAFDAQRPDAVLLDVMLPGEDGFAVCRRLRARDPLVPIVFNTALDGIAEKTKGLELGGDDYVLKTDPPEELLARIARAIRRMRDFRTLQETRLHLGLGRVRIDFAALTLTDEAGEASSLTRTEADIIRLLSSVRGRVFTADEIVNAIRGEGFVCDNNMLYVHIANLRRKLGSARDLLESVRGEGYRLLF